MEALETRAVPAAFTAGNLIVLRVGGTATNGGGGSALGDTSTAAFLDEYTTAGTYVQTIAVSTAVSGGNNPLTLAGNATAEGELNLSTDGQFLLLAGFDTGTGFSGPDSGSAGLGNTIAEVNTSGTVDTTTLLTGGNALNTEPRGAFSADGTNIYLAGQDGTTGGARYINGLGSTTDTNLSGTTLKNIRNVEIWNGQLFIAQDKATGSDLETLGTGAPTTTGQTAAALAGLPNKSGGTSDKTDSFFFTRLGTGATFDGFDTLYIADGSLGLTKYSFNGTSWSANGAIGASANYEGLTAGVSGGTVTLYATNSSGLVKVVDSTGFNGSIASLTPTLLAGFPTNTAFRGVAFAPQTAVGTTTSISSITPLSVNQGQPVSFTATVTSGTTAPAGGAVEFYDSGTSGTLLALATAETTSGKTATFTVTSTTVPAGTFSHIQAFYVGSNGFTKSNSTTFGSTLTVSSAVATQTTITSISPLTTTVGKPISFTATVQALTGSSAPGAGSVAFYNGGTSGTLLANATSIQSTSGTTATFAVTSTSVPAGKFNNITAVYTPSTNFASSTSPVFGSTLQVNIPGVIAAWTFPSPVATLDNSPAPNLGTGTATTLGMTNNYTYSNGVTGSNAGDDVLSTSGTTNPNFTENLWRIRGSTLGGPLQGNGWNLAAPQYSQGVELDASTVGFFNVVFSFDWYSTTQGVRDLQVQYNTNTNNAAGWTNYQGPSPTGTFVATSNDYNNALLSPVNPTLHIDFSAIAGINNDPNFGVRLVSAYDSTGTLGNVYASAASPPGDIIPYNNNSGNWRFGNLIIQGSTSLAQRITTTTTVSATPPGGQSPNQPVMLTALVTPANGTQYPTGTVAFYDGNNQIGTTQTVTQVGTSNVGTASVVLSTLAPGVHPDITAQYTPTQGNGFVGSGSGMSLVTGDPTDNPISYTINAPQATGVDLSPVVNRQFTGLVASFSDGTFTTINGFSASINWGDNHTTSGVITFTGTKNETNINGQTIAVSLYTVTGTHTYASTGSFPLSITISDPNGNTATVTPTARVAYPPLAVSPVAQVVASAGVQLTNQTLATFTDPGLVANLLSLGISDPTTQFSASVCWGDGSPNSAGTITYNATTHVFSVNGSHTYSQTGAHTISVAVTPLTVSVERIDSSDPSALNLVGDENGDGLTDSPSADFIDQYVIGAANQSGPLYTTSLPDVATNGGNEALTNSSYSVSEGEMTLSTNGQYLVLGGYNDTVSAWAPQQTFSDASVITRVIGRVDGNSNINTTTALTDTYSGDNFRGVVSTNGTQFWTAGHSGDSSDFVHYATLGASTSTIITGPTGASNINTVEIFNGQLYEGVRSTSNSAAGIFQVGTGLPTTAGQPQTLFIEVPQTNPLDITSASKPMSPFAFWMADLPNNPRSVNGVNVAYVADAEMGIARYDYTASGWQFSYYIDQTGSFKDSVYTVTNDGLGSVQPTSKFDPTNPIPSSNPNADPTKVGGVHGLTGRVVNGQVQLFAVSGFGTDSEPHPGGSVIEVTDPASLTVPSNFLNTTDPVTTLAINPSNTSQATSTSNINASELTGVAFSPTATVCTPVVVLSNVTSQVTSSATGAAVNHATGSYYSTLTISNKSSRAIAGGFLIQLTNLPAGVTLTGATMTVGSKTYTLSIQQTANGPVLEVPSSVIASLAAGQKLPGIALQFSNPNRLSITFGVQVYCDPNDLL